MQTRAMNALTRLRRSAAAPDNSLLFAYAVRTIIRWSGFIIQHVGNLTKSHTLRKHAYSNILRILPPKNENFQMENSDIFLISAQNIDCRYSLEPPR